MKLSAPLRQEMTQLPQYQLAQALMQQGTSTAPVQSPLEGIARMLTAGVGAYSRDNISNEYQTREQARKDTIAKALGAGQGGNTQGLLEALAANPDTADIALEAQLKRMTATPDLQFINDARGNIVAMDKNSGLPYTPNAGMQSPVSTSGEAPLTPSSGGASSPTAGLGPNAVAKYEENLATSRAERDAAQPQRKASMEARLDTAGNVYDAIDKAKDQSGFWTTGFIGNQLKDLAGTPAHDLMQTVNTIKANVGFDKLQQMRDNSPTGGALGQVSERENVLLQSTIANLEQSQSEEQFKDNLEKVRQQYAKSIASLKEAYMQDYGTLEGFDMTEPMTDGQATVTAAPMEGAQQAPDGKWYVQQDGQWFEVMP